MGHADIADAVGLVIGQIPGVEVGNVVVFQQGLFHQRAGALRHAALAVDDLVNGGAGDVDELGQLLQRDLFVIIVPLFHRQTVAAAGAVQPQQRLRRKADDPRQYLLHILLYGDGVLDDGGISGGEQVVPDLLRRHSGGCGIPEQQLPQQQCVYHLRHQCVFLRRQCQRGDALLQLRGPYHRRVKRRVGAVGCHGQYTAAPEILVGQDGGPVLRQFVLQTAFHQR